MKLERSHRPRGARTQYRIVVAGRLGHDWSCYFEDMSINAEDSPRGTITVLEGEIVDQAGLFGLLARIRNVGLPLLEVRRLDLDTH